MRRAGGRGSRRAAATAAALLLALSLAFFAPGAAADVSAPVLSTEVPAGHGTVIALRRSFDPPRKVDGDISDWHGRPTGFGGTTIYSSGELVYQDHIFDAWGP